MRTAWLLLSGALLSACTNDFDDFRFRSDDSAGGTSATGGVGTGGASGGSGGTAATGGSSATGGATGGTGGATGGAGGATGGAAGAGGATGGTGGATGGTGGATGGTGGATGGTGGATGGAAGASGGQGGTGGTVATCEQLYQGKTGVNSICLDTPQACELNFSSGSATCMAICAAGGGQCTGVFDNNGPCGHGQVFTCGTNVLNDGVCVCSHGCGSGPPCPSGQTCDNGNCN